MSGGVRALSGRIAAILICAMIGAWTLGAARAADQAGLERWIADFKGRARAQGVSAETLDAAFRGVALSAKALELDKDQPEFVMPIWTYLDRLISDKRVAEGRAAFLIRTDQFQAIEARYGVPGSVVAAIWGVESSFGQIRGDFKVIDVLATLAYGGRSGKNGGRATLWNNQLIAALKILQNGDVAPERMLGSWAGAMGHTQFIPTSYLAYAADFAGDGKRDIWSDDPIDALASTANYLKQSGWVTGAPWGFQVKLPEKFDFGLLDGGKRSTDDWRARGLTLSDGAPLPGGFQNAELRLPAGHRGPALLTLPNFNAILRYNNADSYALAVSLLAERIDGKPARNLSWPTDDNPLNRDEREELQRKLTKLGFDTGGVDGILGGNSRRALRRFQAAHGLTADGYPSAKLLAEVRRVHDAPVTRGDVREIQALLLALGYDIGAVDGLAGGKTREAIEGFQRKSGAAAPGEPSRDLLEALRQAVGGPDQTREVQALLLGLGYDIGALDGQAGGKTRTAIRGFLQRRSKRMPPEPSSRLLAELRRAVRGE